MKDYAESELEKLFKPIRAFSKHHRMDVTFVSKSGPAADVIGTLTRRASSIAGDGLPRPRALGNLGMGSVVTKLMASCTTPVQVLR